MTEKNEAKDQEMDSRTVLLKSPKEENLNQRMSVLAAQLGITKRELFAKAVRELLEREEKA